MVLKVYSISNDITAGAVNSELLHGEIDSSGHVSGFVGLDIEGDNLSVIGVSFNNEAGCDSVVQSHEVEPLANLKARRYLEIDGRSMQLIAAGFTYDSQTFSLSIPAQITWSSLKENESDFTWPVEVSTLDSNTYSLAQANLTAFWTAGRDAVQGHLDSGRALKKSVFDAVDKAAVDAIVDNR